MKTAAKNLFVALALLAVVHQAAAQGTTAFTYQGQLHDNGTNANGAYTMIFALYNAVSGGTQIGSTITTSAMLANGLFSVNLDFGAGAFNGSACWLDITVTNGGTSQELSPRVPLLPTPYALFAGTASIAVNATNATTAGSLINGNWSVGVSNIQGNSGIITNAFLIYDNGSLVMALSTNGSDAPGLSAVPRHIKVYDSSGTFVVPTNVTTILVEVWGGGGGGGGCGGSCGTSYGSSGGGGGGGGYGKDVIKNLTPGTNLTVTVGLGGTGGAGGLACFSPTNDGTAGGNGGTSSIGSISVTGGIGGNGGKGNLSGGSGTLGWGGAGGGATASIGVNGQTGLNGSAYPSGGSAPNGGFGGPGGGKPGGGGDGGQFSGGGAGNSGYSGATGRVIIYY